MLDADTKRRIDAARDTLIGKVPDPKSQTRSGVMPQLRGEKEP